MYEKAPVLGAFLFFPMSRPEISLHIGDLFYETEFINGVGVMKYYQEPDTLWVNKMGNGVMDIKSYIDKRFQMIMIEN